MRKTVRYIIHEHNATGDNYVDEEGNYKTRGSAGLHYDLRIEYPISHGINNPVASFAVPKHRFPENPGEKILLVQGYDHELYWIKKNNITIPKGEYGAGTLKMMQKGVMDIEGWSKTHITFVVKGGPLLDGRYSLICPPNFMKQYKKKRRNNPKAGKPWLMIKVKEKLNENLYNLDLKRKSGMIFLI